MSALGNVGFFIVIHMPSEALLALQFKIGFHSPTFSANPQEFLSHRYRIDFISYLVLLPFCQPRSILIMHFLS